MSLQQCLKWVLGRIANKRKQLIIGLTIIFAPIMFYIVSGYLQRPKMSTPEVLYAANRAASADGIHLSEYSTPVAPFEFSKRFRLWRVYYFKKLPGPWDAAFPPAQSSHGAPRVFAVSVSDDSGSTRTEVLPDRGAWEKVPPPAGIKVLGLYTNQAAPGVVK